MIVSYQWTNSSWEVTVRSRLTENCKKRDRLGRDRLKRMIKAVVAVALSWIGSGHSTRSLQGSYQHLRISRVLSLCAKRCRKLDMRSINMGLIQLETSSYTNTIPVKESWMQPRAQNAHITRRFLMRKLPGKWLVRRIKCKSKTMFWWCPRLTRPSGGMWIKNSTLRGCLLGRDWRTAAETSLNSRKTSITKRSCSTLIKSSYRTLRSTWITSTKFSIGKSLESTKTPSPQTLRSRRILGPSMAHTLMCNPIQQCYKVH